jgi:hypothetical protein
VHVLPSYPGGLRTDVRVAARVMAGAGVARRSGGPGPTEALMPISPALRTRSALPVPPRGSGGSRRTPWPSGRCAT